jgi:hypothetical protein
MVTWKLQWPAEGLLEQDDTEAQRRQEQGPADAERPDQVNSAE